VFLVRCPAQLVNHESTQINTNSENLGSTGCQPVGFGCQPKRTSIEQPGYSHSPRTRRCHASGSSDKWIAPSSAVSIETNRWFLKSSSASMKSCGISVDLRMHCTSRSRSVFGEDRLHSALRRSVEIMNTNRRCSGGCVSRKSLNLATSCHADSSRGEFGFRAGRSAESPRVCSGGKRESLDPR